MPPPEAKKPLGDREAVASRWIEQGADFSRHWAFVPPRRQSAPGSQVKDQRSKNPIDAFVSAKRKAAGSGSGTARQPDTLSLCVTLDLTRACFRRRGGSGRLSKDTSPDAYEKLVERLLVCRATAEDGKSLA